MGQHGYGLFCGGDFVGMIDLLLLTIGDEFLIGEDGDFWIYHLDLVVRGKLLSFSSVQYSSVQIKRLTNKSTKTRN